MATVETGGGFPGWAIVLISTLAGVILGFLLNLWRDTQQEKKKRRKEALETHFNSEEIVGVLSQIESFSGLIVHPADKNNVLVFGYLRYGPFSEISEEYDFEKGTRYQAFKAHFPEIAEEWEELHKRALELKEDNQNGMLSSQELEKVSQSLKQLSNTAKVKREDIRRYQIGIVFKYNKRCPICRKF